jgi:hypothetical protein
MNPLIGVFAASIATSVGIAVATILLFMPDPVRPAIAVVLLAIAGAACAVIGIEIDRHRRSDWPPFRNGIFRRHHHE